MTSYGGLAFTGTGVVVGGVVRVSNGRHALGDVGRLMSDAIGRLNS